MEDYQPEQIYNDFPIESESDHLDFLLSNFSSFSSSEDASNSTNTSTPTLSTFLLINSTSEIEMPIAMRQMSPNSKTCVLIYTIIWIIAAAGNLTVFASCYKQYKKHKSRITLLILHLSIADLIVTFCLIPIEIAWRITIQWYGGNLLCKGLQFIRAFGLYLSSMVLICVSFDRFFSILFPLKFVAVGKQKVKIMLMIAWILSILLSLPQAFIWSVESHPQFTSFKQCRTSSSQDVRIHTIVFVSATYLAPLLVIIFTYTAILLKIMRRSRQQETTSTMAVLPPPSPAQGEEQEDNDNSSNGSTYYSPSPRFRGSVKFRFHNGDSTERSGPKKSLSLRRDHKPTDSRLQPLRTPQYQCGSDSEPSPSPLSRTMSSTSKGKSQLMLRVSTNATSSISRAKSRTLRLTIVIILVFVLCWTPYVVMTLWYMFDWTTAEKVDPIVQEALFMMAVANSCVNPLVYGSFTKNCCGLKKRLSLRRRSNRARNNKCQRNGGRPSTIKQALESQASIH